MDSTATYDVIGGSVFPGFSPASTDPSVSAPSGFGVTSFLGQLVGAANNAYDNYVHSPSSLTPAAQLAAVSQPAPLSLGGLLPLLVIGGLIYLVVKKA